MSEEKKNEEERIAEVVMAIKMPEALKKVIEGLVYVDFKGDKLKLYAASDIAREALLKGLRLILLEREIFEKIIEKEARAGAERIYASLVTEPETSQTAQGMKSEESVNKTEE